MEAQKAGKNEPLYREATVVDLPSGSRYHQGVHAGRKGKGNRCRNCQENFNATTSDAASRGRKVGVVERMGKN